MNCTPERVTKLEPNQIFVFGSNYEGRHGKGAAKQALKFGAIRGQGVGFMGQTYGIATKGYNLNILPLYKIEVNVQRFLKIAALHPHLVFLVTPIGCGLAGYKSKDIAPMFKDVPKNVVLPQCFIDFNRNSPTI